MGLPDKRINLMTAKQLLSGCTGPTLQKSTILAANLPMTSQWVRAVIALAPMAPRARSGLVGTLTPSAVYHPGFPFPVSNHPNPVTHPDECHYS